MKKPMKKISNLLVRFGNYSEGSVSRGRCYKPKKINHDYKFRKESDNYYNCKS